MDKLPEWPRWILRAAALYNLLWGAWVVLFPNHWFDITGIEHPNYPGIWQCVGMIVGVYGIGYWFAANNFVTHWPVILVGFLGKIFGPIGFLQSALTGALPWSWGMMIVTNDLIWWIPFAAMLYLAFKFQSDPRYHSKSPEQIPETLTREQANRLFHVTADSTLESFSKQHDVLLVFLRHAGCTFCRETLDELKKARSVWTAKKITPVVVHMGSEEEGIAMMKRFELADLPVISDPDCNLFRAYHLPRGKWQQLFGPRVWVEGFKTAILKGYGLGKLVGDGFQLSGAFLLRNGNVIAEYPSVDAADNCPWKPALNSVASLALGLVLLQSPFAFLAAQEPTSVIQIKETKPGDRFEVRHAQTPIEDVQRVNIDVYSERGIGQCILSRKTESWPKSITVRFHLRGLESLTLTVPSEGNSTSKTPPKSQYRGGWNSTSGPMDWEMQTQDGAEQPARKPEALSIKQFPISIDGISTPKNPTIPLENGHYFEWTIPSDWYAKLNPPTLELQWVDFFRN